MDPIIDGGLWAEPSDTERTSTIRAGYATPATTGIPLISEIVESHVDVPVLVSLPLVNRRHALVYWTGRLADKMAIRGRSSVTLHVATSDDSAHIMAYLYDVNALGKGTLITHGTATLHDIASQAQTLRVDLNAVAYDVPAGRRLGLVIDTLDPLYATRTGLGARLRFPHSAAQPMTLDIETRR